MSATTSTEHDALWTKRARFDWAGELPRRFASRQRHVDATAHPQRGNVLVRQRSLSRLVRRSAQVRHCDNLLVPKCLASHITYARSNGAVYISSAIRGRAAVMAVERVLRGSSSL